MGDDPLQFHQETHILLVQIKKSLPNFGSDFFMEIFTYPASGYRSHWRPLNGSSVYWVRKYWKQIG